ncbi:hypothetical protein MMC26_002187 [Xylographa opegraphella]|nr:hypothetical protein [Xylographa opegraphella]
MLTIPFLVVALIGFAAALPTDSAGALQRRTTLRHGFPHLNTTQSGPGTVVRNPTALSFYNPSLNNGTAGYDPPDTYECYSGPAANFPPISTWMNFLAAFKRNQQYSLVLAGDTGPEQRAIYKAIITTSRQAKVDARLILAVIIQESTGNVHVGCTNNGIENCGLMQSFNPVDRAYDPKNMQASITQMVVDGTQGTSTGSGLVQLFNNIDAKTGGNVWNVLRAYNSGSVDFENLSDPVGATASYVSDVANRLLGWNGYGNGGTACKFT